MGRIYTPALRLIVPLIRTRWTAIKRQSAWLWPCYPPLAPIWDDFQLGFKALHFPLPFQPHCFKPSCQTCLQLSPSTLWFRWLNTFEAPPTPLLYQVLEYLAARASSSTVSPLEQTATTMLFCCMRCPVTEQLYSSYVTGRGEQGRDALGYFETQVSGFYSAMSESCYPLNGTLSVQVLEAAERKTWKSCDICLFLLFLKP